MTDLLSKFKKLKISNGKNEIMTTVESQGVEIKKSLNKIKFKKGQRIKILGKGSYKGQIGFFDCYIGDHAYCVMDSFPLNKVKIKLERVHLFEETTLV